MMPVGGGSPLPSGGLAVTSGGKAVRRALARRMVGVPAGREAGSAPAAGMVSSCPWSALSWGQSA